MQTKTTVMHWKQELREALNILFPPEAAVIFHWAHTYHESPIWKLARKRATNVFSGEPALR